MLAVESACLREAVGFAAKLEEGVLLVSAVGADDSCKIAEEGPLSPGEGERGKSPSAGGRMGGGVARWSPVFCWKGETGAEIWDF